MNREKVRRALTHLDSRQYPTNPAVIAECIRMELEESGSLKESAEQAQGRVAKMLGDEFIYAVVTEPFKLDDTDDFMRWGVTMRYPSGDAFRVVETD